MSLFIDMEKQVVSKVSSMFAVTSSLVALTRDIKELKLLALPMNMLLNQKSITGFM